MRTILSVICSIFAVVACLGAQRLPGNAIPDNYKLTFTPDFSSDTFTGQEEIYLHMLRPSNVIVLNAAEIEFEAVMAHLGKDTLVGKVSDGPQDQMVTLTFDKPIPAGPVLLHIHYKGKLNNQLRGFYLSRANGRKYAVTQFESVAARRAFPSFDEPIYKSTFDVTVIADKRDTAISNGKIISDMPGPGENQHTIKFSTTPKMSTYLVAVAVGDFYCQQGEQDGIPIRVCATPDKKNLLSFALESAEHILHFYNNYYSIKYPYGKLDILAVPDFEAGAMENTAAIFSRETVLTIDDKTASVDAHQSVASVLAHEMAHQWFGDLVTMRWWDDIWLNEGFATWMSQKPVADWKQDWDLDINKARATGRALNTDSLQHTRPIRAKAETPDQIDEMFDGIAYGKAASVLRMIEAYVGPDVFRKGVNAYLEKHAYGNATSEDFWNAIAEASHKPVDQIMSTFITQAGAPLLTVKAACKNDKTEVTLTQQRFYYDGKLLKEPSGELWQIPVCMKTEKGRSCELVSKREQTVELNGCSSWVFTNTDGAGHYRSIYDPAMLRQLRGIAESKLSPEERISLLGDSWAAVRAGKYRIGDYLSLVEGMQQEPSSPVVEILLANLYSIQHDLLDDSNREHFQVFARDLLRPAVQELGWSAAPGEDDKRRSLRADILGAYGYIGRDPQALKKSRELAMQYMESPASVDSTLAQVVFPVAAIEGDEALYNKILESAKKAKSPEQYYLYIRALGGFSQPELVQRTFDLALSPEIRNQDAAGLIARIFANPDSRSQAWSLVRKNWTEVQAKTTESSGRVIIGATSSFCDARTRDEVQQFFAEHKVPAADRSLPRALESIDNCIDLKAQQQQNLDAWLGQQRSGGQESDGTTLKRE
jgi:aminopeptidase N/puromycin-sensitive aminopeptidase